MASELVTCLREKAQEATLSDDGMAPGRFRDRLEWKAADRIEALEQILRAAVKDADWCKEHGDPLPPWNDAAVAALSGTPAPDALNRDDIDYLSDIFNGVSTGDTQDNRISKWLADLSAHRGEIGNG